MGRALHEVRRAVPRLATAGFLTALNLVNLVPAARAEAIAKSGSDCPVQSYILAVGQNISQPVAMGSEAVTVTNLGKVNFFNRIFNLPGFPTQPAAEVSLSRSPLTLSWNARQIHGKLGRHSLEDEAVDATIDTTSGLKGEAGEYNVRTFPDKNVKGSIDVTICYGPQTTFGFDQPHPLKPPEPTNPLPPGTEII